MIAYDFSDESTRTRTGFYNLLSPAGRAHLAALLTKEKEILDNFVLSYETPELRRLEAKARRSTLTPEEQSLLQKSPKKFKGALKSGGLIEDEKSIKVISNYLECLDIINTDLEFLSNFDDDASKPNTEIILGKQMSYWNLHPNQFTVSVYKSIFQAPEYTKQELAKIFNMKIGADKHRTQPLVFDGKDEVETLLVNFRGTPSEHETVKEKLLNLTVLADAPPREYKANVIRALNILFERDDEFDFDVYKNVKNYLPQYHNKKAKYFIYLLSQFNQVQVVPVSSRIDITSIHALYRKADELCFS